jgi:hypothetical protein
MSDGDALVYADANGVPQADVNNDEPLGPNDQDAIAEQLQMAATPSLAQDTPKGKMTRKRKSAIGEIDDGESSAAKNTTPASPDKKRKRQSKVAEIAEEPKKSARKKKN